MKSINILLCLLILTISVIAKPYKGAEYRTKETFLYGKFEVRMKSAPVSGTLTTMFTYHELGSGGLADWNEIDIEILGNKTNEVQYNVITPNQQHNVHEQPTKFNPHDGFHVYSIIWTPDYIAFEIDGFEVYRQTGEHIQTVNLPQKLMMNVWQPIYEDWVGAFDPSDLPVYGYYDWIKVYSYTPGQNDNFTFEWEDNFDSFDQTRWQKATHTFDGNNSDFVPENIVFQDGYMILCLTDRLHDGYNGDPIDDEDLAPPYPVSAWAYQDILEITFSEPLDQVSALEPANYLTPGLTVNDIQLDETEQKVLLSVSGRDPEVKHNIFVNNIKDQAATPNSLTLQVVTIDNMLEGEIFINIGGEKLDEFLPDQLWQFDNAYGYAGGDAESTTQMTGSRYSEIHKTNRTGISEYLLRVPDGEYDVIPYVNETEYDEAGARVFDIVINNEVYLDDLDIFSEVGKNFAYQPIIENVVIDNGLMHLMFTSEAGEPVISGLQIIPKVTEVEDWGSLQPVNWQLGNYPNPFNPTTTIEYNVPKEAYVTIDVFNSIGQKVENLVNEYKSAGSYTLTFDAFGKSSGIYYCVLQAENKTITRPLLLLK